MVKKRLGAPALALQHFTRKLSLQISGLRMRSVMWNQFPRKKIADRFSCVAFVETSYSFSHRCQCSLVCCACSEFLWSFLTFGCVSHAESKRLTAFLLLMENVMRIASCSCISFVSNVLLGLFLQTLVWLKL